MLTQKADSLSPPNTATKVRGKLKRDKHLITTPRFTPIRGKSKRWFSNRRALDGTNNNFPNTLVNPLPDTIHTDTNFLPIGGSLSSMNIELSEPADSEQTTVKPKKRRRNKGGSRSRDKRSLKKRVRITNLR